jgi:epoxyqueuosine reductase
MTPIKLMRPKRVALGAMRHVPDDTPRFDQRHQMFMRATWDSAWRETARRYFAKFSGRAAPRKQAGFERRELALEMAGWHPEMDFGSGQFIGGEGFESWTALPLGRGDSVRLPADLGVEKLDPETASRLVKRAARFYGAALVGTTVVDPRWVYSHSYHTLTKESQPIDLNPDLKYAVVLAHEMDYAAMRRAPGYIGDAAASVVYSRMALCGAMLAHFIRGLGYTAVPMGNDTALSVPLAIDAGLGELSRMGIMITPQYGPRVRLHKIFTDLPLAPDSPIEFGVWEFCRRCAKCAHHCPGQAIDFGEPRLAGNNPCNREGVINWPVNAEKCLGYWAKLDTDCGVCIRVCPFNKSENLWHEVVKLGIRHFPGLDRLFLRLDDMLGYGRAAGADAFWDQ